MATHLRTSLLLVLMLTACGPSSRRLSGTDTRPVSSENTVQSEVPAAVQADSLLVDSIAGKKPSSLWDLPQSQDGEIILSEGFYEGEFKSYCLQPGTPDPTDRDAYLQGPLNSYRKNIVETVLRHSLKKPELKQRNIQLLLWSVVSGSDYKKLSWDVQSTAEELLTRKQIFELKGGAMGVIKTVANTLPGQGLNIANTNMKALFEQGSSSYEAFERLAVLRQPSQIHRPDLKKDQWYHQAQGYYLRYFPGGYQQVKVQVYVPAGMLDSTGKMAGRYLLFDPVTLMAIPANSNSQRLGIGAPVVDILRKVIQINKGNRPPAPKKPNPPANPKTSPVG